VAGGGVGGTVAGSGGDVTGSGGGRVAGRGVVGGTGVMEDVVGQERLQRELLPQQLEEGLVLVLVEVALEEKWQEVVLESPAAEEEHDNPLVLQQEELLGEELKTTPPQKLTPCYRPFGPFAQYWQ